MEKKFDDLYLKSDSNSGESDYYVDKNLTIPYNGIVIDEVNGVILWRFDVKNGKRTGLEYTYASDGKLEQINECKGNFQFGVSKEYDENGGLTSVSVVWNNGYLKTLTISNNTIIDRTVEYDLTKTKYPEKISDLLNLTDEALVNYKFSLIEENESSKGWNVFDGIDDPHAK